MACILHRKTYLCPQGYSFCNDTHTYSQKDMPPSTKICLLPRYHVSSNMPTPTRTHPSHKVLTYSHKDTPTLTGTHLLPQEHAPLPQEHTFSLNDKLPCTSPTSTRLRPQIHTLSNKDIPPSSSSRHLQIHISSQKNMPLPQGDTTSHKDIPQSHTSCNDIPPHSMT